MYASDDANRSKRYAFCGFRCEEWRTGEEFDAYWWRHPMTIESSYINSLKNSPYSSTVKILSATLPEPWTMFLGLRSKQIGPCSTDLDARVVGLVQGLQELVVGSGSDYLEGWCCILAALAARTEGK